MARQHIVDIGMNDQLPEVIRKCNYNFRVSASNQNRQTRSDIRNYNIDTADSIEELRLVCAELAAEKSTVTVAQIQVEGQEIAIITVDGVQYSLYAPSGGGGEPAGGPYVPVADTITSTMIDSLLT